MKLLKSAGTLLKTSDGKILKLQDDNYVEPKPDILQIKIAVDANQVFTLPTPNAFTYVNYLGTNTSSGTLVYNYTVDWGDGFSNSITTYNSASRIHTYAIAGSYIIEISGVFPCWDTNNDAQIKLLITQVISWGNTGLKKINFYGCSGLITFPEQQSKLTQLLTAQHFAYNCASLTSVPYGLFFGNANIADFSYVFAGCAKLKILYTDLFRDCIKAIFFNNAFNGCVKLEYIPALLFSTCPLVRSFSYVFANCTTLTTLPGGLLTYSTYGGCDYSSICMYNSGLTSVPYNLLANTSTTIGSNFIYAFYNCTGLTSIPDNFFDNVKISQAQYLFYSCSNIATIPPYLFRYQNLCIGFYQTFSNCVKLQGIPTGCFDLNVGGVNSCTTMYGCFSSSGSNPSTGTFIIADNVFDQLYKVTTFSHCFSGVVKLFTIPSYLFAGCLLAIIFDFAFSSTSISSIPATLFSTCIEALSFQGTFSSCASLTSTGIPSTLFNNNVKVTYFGYVDVNITYSNYGVFYNCTNADFTYIPNGLFDNNVNVLSFAGAFFGTKITAIPTDLFKYCVSVVNFTYTFGSTAITSLSANVFEHNRSIVTVYGCFNSCLGLTSVDVNLFNNYYSASNAIVNYAYVFYGCNNVAFTTVPADLFRYSINAKQFQAAFGYTKISTIPSGLFQYNTLAENFTNCFIGILIISIPSNLFTGLSQIKYLSSCFQNCHELLSIPATLFDSVGTAGTVNYTSCFSIVGTGAAYNKITGAVPELWLKPNNPVGTSCFLNRTAVSNYASIPSNWK